MVNGCKMLNWSERWISLRRSPTLREKSLSFRQLAVMLTSGVSLTRSLQVLAQPGTHPKLREAWLAVLQSVMAGRSLWETMARYNRVFSLLEVSMIRSSERSSCLNSCLYSLAISLEREAKLQSRISAALQYPLLLGGMALAGTCVFVLWLLPAFMQGLELGEELPWFTRLLLGVSQLLRNRLLVWGLVLGGALTVAAVTGYRRTPWGRYQWQCASLNLVGVGHLVKMTLVARFCEMLATALRSGMSLPTGLEFASESLANYPLASAVRGVLTRLEDGCSLGQAFDNSRFFPKVVGKTLILCDEVGNPVANIEHIGRFMMMQVDQIISQWSQLIEPVMLLVIAVFMTVSLLAMFSPLYKCFCAL